MDVTLPKKDLIRLFSRAQGVADKKSTMPILTNALVQAASDGRIRVSATDLFLAVSTTAPAQVSRPGAIAVSAKDVLDRLKVMPEGGIQLLVNENSGLLLRSVGTKREFRLRGMIADDYPALPGLEPGARELTIPASVLGELMAKTFFSIAPDETRPHLNSALFEWRSSALRMVSTDGHRLSLHTIQGQSIPADLNVLLPLKGIQELRRVCDDLKAERSDGDGPSLRMSVGTANVFFLREDTMLAIKLLVDVAFPPYQQVIPKSFAHSVSVSRGQLIDVLRAMSVAASERTGSVRMALSRGLMRVTSENPDTGEAFDELPVDYSGPDIVIGFNVRYLMDALAAVDDEEVKLSFSGELDPVTVEPLEKKGFLAVVMPMRI